MSLDALSFRRFAGAPIASTLLTLSILACSSDDGGGPSDTGGPGVGPDATLTASVVVSDISHPAGADAVTGEIMLSGVTVELWNGEEWLTVTDQPTDAEIAIGDGAAEAKLVPVTEIPAGTYTKTRLTATSMVIELSVVLDGRELSARITPPTQDPVIIEKDMEVTVNDDGSSTFRVELAMIQSIELRRGASGTEIVVKR